MSIFSINSIINSLKIKNKMKLFHKHEKKISTIHEITNLDWEDQIDKIYLQILSYHSSALCLATNTIRNNDTDKVGTISDEIVFRFHKNIDSSNHKIISKLKREIFNEIFKKYNDIDKKERNDFYHINKDIYLESDYLVYPLHQSLDKKGLLICEYPNEEQVLNKICQSFVQLLGN